MGNRGSLIVISGFSGVGKGTVVKRLVSDYGYELSISATTRSPRTGEEHGREYFFMDKSEFENLIDYGGFISGHNMLRITMVHQENLWKKV